jgi:hypothetical protein
MRKCLIALLFAALLLLTLGTNPRQAVPAASKVPLRAGLLPSERVTVNINQTNLAQALVMYSELTGRTQLPKTSPLAQRADEFFGGYLSRWHFVKLPPQIQSGIEYHRDGLFSVVEVKEHLEALFATKRLVLVPDEKKYFRVLQSPKPGGNRPEL